MSQNYIIIEIFNGYSQNTMLADFSVSLLSGVTLALFFFFIKSWVQSKNNITGKWLISEVTFNSDYTPFIGMQVWSTVNILHSGESVSGYGEKVEEITLDKGYLSYEPKHTHVFSLTGRFEWSLFSKNSFKINCLVESSRKTSILYDLHFNKDKLEGYFVANAGKSYGTVTFLRKDISLFGSGIYFIFFTLLSKALRVNLVDNIRHHYIKYYSRSKRVENKFPTLRKIIVMIEDREFYAHNGFRYKALLRGLLSQTFIGKNFGLIKSGGSTITMQLSRTLFIKDYSKKVRRKILELLLSSYLEKLFYSGEENRIKNKDKILDLYIVSVRFANNIFGIYAASQYFFKSEDYEDSVENGIFLTERLSSVTYKYSENRVNMLCDMVENNGIKVNRNKVISLYSQIKSGEGLR